jgi:putative ABC transport system permease protein
LGASVRGVLALLSSEFLKLVALATLLAWPVAYLAMGAWLRNFAYRADLSPWTFLAAGAAALTIAFITVAVQTYRAASSNPLASLKSE